MAAAGTREPLFSWRRVSFLLIGVLLVLFLWNTLPSRAEPQNNLGQNKPLHRTFQFGDITADNEAIDGLTDAQCTAEFPLLFTEIDRSVAYWKQQNHTISAADVTIKPEHAAMRILIHNNELRILESYHSVDPRGASPDRALGVLHLLQRALDSAMAADSTLPTVEIALNFQDDAPTDDTHSFWAFARTLSQDSHQRLWLMPNFDFWYYFATGPFIEAKRTARHHDTIFTKKIPKLVWRGNPDFNSEIRGGLINATQGKDWADVLPVHFNDDPPVAIPVDEFCAYAMTVYTEGVTYSGRLKFLMNCKSLLFSHEMSYATHYSHILSGSGPSQNYIPVRRDWSDLEEKVQYYLTHPEEAETIIRNSLETFRSRYTTRAATSCYIRRLIQGYGEVAFRPEVMRPGGVKMRGVSYEEFMYNPQDVLYD